MNVTAIASRPRTSTGPPLERLYAVDPDGVAQIIPSQGIVAEILAADRPLELDHPAEHRARGDDVVHGGVRLAVELNLQRRQLDHGVLAREHAAEVALEVVRLDRREEADAAEVDADHRDGAAEQLPERAQDRPVAAERDRDVRAARVRVRRRGPSRPRRRRPPARARPPRATSTRPCATTAAVSTARGDCCVDPLVEVIGKRRVVGLHEVEEQLPVALRPGESGVYDAGDARSPFERSLGHLPDDAAAHGVVADDAALPHVGAARLELRLDEHDRLPARRGEPRARAAARSAREMNETSQTTSCGGYGSSVSARAFVRSSTVTRGSSRSRGCSWP